jgi:hypothetical protein
MVGGRDQRLEELLEIRTEVSGNVLIEVSQPTAADLKKKRRVAGARRCNDQ